MSATDRLHVIAFDHLLQLPGVAEAGAMAFEEIPAEQRERALQIACRRLAFQILYELDVGSLDPANVRQRLGGVEGLGPIALERVATHVGEAWEQRREADAEFLALAPDWPPHRQAAVDRAILRMARAEMLSGRTPTRVVVSEAVELARHFSTEKSPAFVNALLDKVMRRLETGGA
jgi:N utilization substance protein B